MALIIKENKKDKEDKHNPHLALCDLETQGGAANGRNVSLLMKNDVPLSEEHKLLLASILDGSLQKDNKQEIIINKENEESKEMDKEMNKEINLAVDTLKEELKKATEEINKAKEEIEKAREEREEAFAALAEVKKEAANKKLAERLEVIKMFVKDEEKATSLHKAIGALVDEGFDAVIDVLKVKEQAVDESDLTKQLSQHTEEDNKDTDILGDILRAKYGIK